MLSVTSSKLRDAQAARALKTFQGGGKEGRGVDGEEGRAEGRAVAENVYQRGRYLGKPLLSVLGIGIC